MLGLLAETCIARHPAEAASVLELASPAAAADVIGPLPAAAASGVLAAMSPRPAAEVLNALSPADSAQLLDGLGVERAAVLLRLLDPSVRDRIIGGLPTRMSMPLRLVLRFPAGSVGTLIDPNVATVHAETSIGEAGELSRRNPKLLRKYLYVLDHQQHLIGVADSRDLLLLDSKLPIRKCAREKPQSLRARTSLREANMAPGWERYQLLPVIDVKGVFLGVLRRSRLLEALAEEAKPKTGEGLADLALELADLYWRTAAELLTSLLGGGQRR